jgi:uncharacterized protein YuzE
MKIAYSPDADVLTIQLRAGRPADSRDLLRDDAPEDASYDTYK